MKYGDSCTIALPSLSATGRIDAITQAHSTTNKLCFTTERYPLERVVITGRGAITPLGLDAATTWQALVAGQSGITRIDHFDAAAYPVQIAGYIHNFDPTAYLPRKEARRMARFSQFALAAAHEAVRDAALDLDLLDRERVGVEMGNAVGSVETIVEQFEILKAKGPRHLVPTVIPGGLINMATCQIAMHFGILGPGGSPVAACATGLYALSDACRRIQRGEADVMLAGACESFMHPVAIAGFWRIQALSTRNDDPAGASRPFDAERDGTVMSEGAACLVLESESHAIARGATILGEIVGIGQSMDAFHLIAPDDSGSGAARAMRLALREAQTAPEALDWIVGHGTATPLNDLSEVRALKTVLGEKAYDIPVSGLKSMTGHMLGASGAVNVLAAVEALQSGIIPPTINLHTPDPALDLDFVPLVARRKTVNTVMTNAFGFGGQNGSMVVRRYVAQA